MKITKLIVVMLALMAGAFGQLATTGNITATGSTCATAHACVALNGLQSASRFTGGVTISLTGTWSATATFEATSDGTNWVAINGMSASGTTPVSTATANDIFQLNAAGYIGIRVRASALASGTMVVTIQSSPASARSGGGAGGSGGSVTQINTSGPIGGGPISTTGTITCTTCDTAAGTLTSTALMTGAGSKATQTPSTTATLDSSGNVSFPGHTTFEGVTSTGATGTGKLVYDTGATLQNPAIVPLYSTAQTGISMIAGTGVITTFCTSGVCTITTPGADGVYRIGATIIETAAGVGGTCAAGSIRMEMGYRDAITSVTYATGNTNIAFATLNTAAAPLTTLPMAATAPGVGNAFISLDKTFHAKAGTAITYQINEIAGSNCTTPPVFAIYPYLYGPLGF